MFSPGKNCQNTGWGKSRPNSSHSAGPRVVFPGMHCLAARFSPSGEEEFCNLSTYARRSIVDPRGKREEMEEMVQQIPKYFDWTDLSGADRKPYETYEIKQAFEFGCN